MISKTIWGDEEVRDRWEAEISQKAVTFFELFVLAPNRDQLKSKKQHAEASRIPVKYVSRAAMFLHDVGLLVSEADGDAIRLRFHLPIVHDPPTLKRKPLWATDERKNRASDLQRKMHIYELDGGLCSYCEIPVSLREAKLDHIFPDSKGGADRPPNLTIACGACNRGKWSWIPGDAGFLHPKRFRQRRVLSVSFDRVDGFMQPVRWIYVEAD